MPGLDGLRGIAILVVMLFHESSYFTISHAGFEGILRWHVLNHGWIAVDLFFVLSGFLITGILLSAAENISHSGKTGYFLTFYVRRSLRIFPIYFIFIAFVWYLNEFRFHNPPVNMWWYALYIDNWKPGFAVEDSWLGHLWTLAVEEQFYLAWPLLVLLAGRKRLLFASASICALSLATRLVLHFGFDVSDEGIHRLTVCRIDTFALGGLAALAVREKRTVIDSGATTIYILGAVLALAGFGTIYLGSIHTYGVSILGVGFALLISAIAVRPGALVQWPPLCAIGAVSYSMYLFHQLIYYKLWSVVSRFIPFVKGQPGLFLHLAFLVVGGALSYAFAAFTFRFIEGPFNRLKSRFSYGRSGGKYRARSSVEDGTGSGSGGVRATWFDLCGW
jgi:peptidoglycan/LPS O-acetylase OafA/YrhL